MLEIIDRSLLLIFCSVIYFFEYDSTYTLVPLLVALIITCLNTVLDNPKTTGIIVLFYFLLCMIFPNLLYFLPIAIYDIVFLPTWRISFFVLLPYAAHTNFFHTEKVLLLHFLFIGIAILAKYKTKTLNHQNEEYKRLRDSSKEISLLLEEKNRGLLEKQDNEINMATLNERNRISKEIHDNIGHLLSRSLIQIGALLTITKDPFIKENLTSLKTSISEGMDSIRSSIHNMHDESIDLYATIESLVNTFSFCKVSLRYDITNTPPLKLKYCFIAIIKESLGNIMKHSNATLVEIRLKEHPSMYQLIISDNGQVSDDVKEKIEKINHNFSTSDGMGLQNIIERVKGFNGNYNISAQKGFRIFITVPKS